MVRLFKDKRRKLLILLGLSMISVIITMFPNSKEREMVSNIFTSFDSKSVIAEEKQNLFEYIEIIDSCGPHFEGVCVNVRKEPNTNSQVITKLRDGVVLKVDKKIYINNETWYKISFEDEWFRYSERINGDWYVSSMYTKPFFDEGVKILQEGINSSSSKLIVIDRSDQKLYAYEGKNLYTENVISTGLDLSPTPRGVFKIYRKTPSRYMQGPIPGISEKEYDLPGVPWDLYFTEQGAVIHGAYWHNNFGKPWSNGCVNLSSENAKKLYMWADLGTQVIVRD